MGVRKYPLNEFVFHTINHKTAYILGLWWADGSIYEINGKIREINITLGYEDSDLLEKVKIEMGTTIPLRVHKKTNARVLKITSPTICRQIMRLGGTPRKSLNLQWPKIPDEYFPAFLRGYFDGDGGIFKKKGKVGYIFVSSISCGTKSFLEILQQKIRQTDPTINGRIVCGSNCYSIRFSQSETKKLGYIMYSYLPNCLYMQRKYDKFKEMYDEKTTSEYSLQCILTNNLVVEMLLDIRSKQLRYMNDIIEKYAVSRPTIMQIFDRIAWKKVSDTFDLDTIKSNILRETPINENTRKIIKKRIENGATYEQIDQKYHISKVNFNKILNS